MFAMCLDNLLVLDTIAIQAPPHLKALLEIQMVKYPQEKQQTEEKRGEK